MPSGLLRHFEGYKSYRRSTRPNIPKDLDHENEKTLDITTLTKASRCVAGPATPFGVSIRKSSTKLLIEISLFPLFSLLPLEPFRGFELFIELQSCPERKDCNWVGIIGVVACHREEVLSAIISLPCNMFPLAI